MKYILSEIFVFNREETEECFPEFEELIQYFTENCRGYFAAYAVFYFDYKIRSKKTRGTFLLLESLMFAY